MLYGLYSGFYVYKQCLYFLIDINVFYMIHLHTSGIEMIEIVIYETKSGQQPFLDWFNELDKVVMAKVSKRLLRLSLGNLGDYKALGGSLFELRFSIGIRVYFSRVDTKIVLLLTGGNKNNKSEQNRDISKAKGYLEDFWERENE